ncbi:MAG TPA: hypothetical protein DDZ51_12745 [Planctomycetaceae bacterium]|nr:hypothetical protein [Planctomycetaceae bacterium]
MSDRQRLAVALLLASLAFWAHGGGAIAGRDIAEDGLFVLVVEDQSRPEAITDAQGRVMGSLTLLEATKAKGGEYRKEDAQNDLTGTGVWAEIRALVTEPPAIAIAKDGRVRVEAIPEDVTTAVGWIQ